MITNLLSVLGCQLSVYLPAAATPQALQAGKFAGFQSIGFKTDRLMTD